MLNDSEFMKRAIDKTREGIAAGQAPFGLVVEGGLLAEDCVALFREWKEASLGRSY